MLDNLFTSGEDTWSDIVHLTDTENIMEKKRDIDGYFEENIKKNNYTYDQKQMF